MLILAVGLIFYQEKLLTIASVFTDVSLTLLIAFSALLISVTNLIKGGKSSDLRKKVSDIVLEFILLSTFILLLKLVLSIGVSAIVIWIFLIATIIMFIVITAEIITIFQDAI